MQQAAGPRTARARWSARTRAPSSRSSYRVNGLKGPPDGVQGDDRRDRRERRRRAAPRARRSACSRATSSGRTRSRSPREVVLEDEGIEGLDVPSSEFVTADDLVSQSSLAAIWQRIQGASTGGTPTGLHGNEIAYVKALPSGQLLSTTTETTIKVTDELAVRGRRRGLGREPGGPDQGHADDPEAARPDRQDRDHPDHRPGRDEVRRRSRSARSCRSASRRR